MPCISSSVPGTFWLMYRSIVHVSQNIIDSYVNNTRTHRYYFHSDKLAMEFVLTEKAKVDGPIAPTATITTPTTTEEDEMKSTTVSATTVSATEDCWALVQAILPHTERLLLWGPPGVGKTHIATMHRSKDQFYSITLTEETPAAELRGHFIMKGGDFIWHHGPAIKAWIEGKLLIVNEIHKASNDAFSFLLALLDDKNIAALTLPNGETVYPHANFQVIATSNAAPDSLPEALQSRFAVSIEITRPADGAIASLPSDLQEAAKNSATIDDAHRRVGIRSWKAFAHLRQFVGPEVAAKAVFADRSKDILNSLLIASK